jgi:hypothetical protein
VIQYHDSSEEMNKNIVFDIPNLTLFEIWNDF